MSYTASGDGDDICRGSLASVVAVEEWSSSSRLDSDLKGWLRFNLMEGY